MSPMKSSFLMCIVAALAASCSIVDPAYYEALQAHDAGVTGDGSVANMDGGDAGSVDAGVDAGGFNPIVTSERCGMTNAVIISHTGLFEIDTSGATEDVSATCGGRPTPGNDLFLAIDVSAGEYWHFHLQVHPSETNRAARNPTLYLLPASCDPRFCAQKADACMGPSDEHFAFVATTNGRWYLGIDDANAGGGRYLLNAIRPVCGNNVVEHGESCDGDTTVVDCDDSCRAVLSAEGGSTAVDEHIPNDNAVEANVIAIQNPGDHLEVGGALAGMDCYPAVFSVRVPPGGAGLRVTALDTSDNACVSATTAPFTLELKNAAGVTRGGGLDANGCPVVDVPGLPAGVYFVYAAPDDYTAAANLFKLKFELF